MQRRSIVAAWLVLTLVGAWACDSDDGGNTVGGPDVAAGPDVITTDIASDTGAIGSDTTEADVAGEPDVAPEPLPRAWVWVDPNNVHVEEPVEVELDHLTDPEGYLIGKYANVSNCLNQEGGVSSTMPMGNGEVTVYMCVMEPTVTPDENGDYLHVLPPQRRSDPNDPFAEVQMYYHINRVHDFYRDGQGYDGMDLPMRAVVNFQVGLKIAGTAWMPMDNAMFMPKESMEQLGDALGVIPPLDEDAIIFFQGNTVDFAYDGDVVYHEYTHATVGGERLFGTRTDTWGPDHGPRSLNEAHADYFTASLTNDAIIGGYALGELDATRNLGELRKCPDHLMGEEHYDGQIFSSALWGIREALGQADADAIIFDALLGYGLETGFDDAVAAIVANAAELDPPRDTEVEAVFAEHGLPNCERRRHLGTEGVLNRTFLPGTMTTGAVALSEQAPAYVQFSFDVEEGAEAVAIQWVQVPDALAQIVGALGGEMEPMAMQVALKPGPDAIQWTYDGNAASDAAAVVPMTREGDVYRVVVAGSCLTAGPHTLQALTTSELGGMIRDITATAVTPEEGETIATYDCAPAR